MSISPEPIAATGKLNNFRVLQKTIKNGTSPISLLKGPIARHDRGTHFVTAQHLSQPFPSIAFGAMPVQPILGTACHSGLASRSA